MTDKQIIIDGVDVSGCSCHYNGWSQLYRDNRDMCDKGYDLECKPKENGCYHYTKCLEEQLKAKEQECEAYKMEAEEGKEINAELKAENDNIKEIFDGLFKVQYKLADNNKKLRQCLTEIKEICKKESGWVNCSDNMPTETAIFAEQILQKISECEGNDEIHSK